MPSNAKLTLEGTRRFLSPRLLLTVVLGVGPLTLLAAAIKGKRA